MPHKKLNEVRKELKHWGKFWNAKEYGEGYGSVSLSVQIFESAGGNAFSSADNIYVPPHIEELDNLINQLRTECKIALRQKYITKTKYIAYWADEAERILMVSA